jgi:threonine synthase
VGDFMILDAVRQSGGLAIAVDEARLKEWLHLTVSREGISLCPESAACVGALEALRAKNWIKPDEEVVIFNTGALQKYPEAMATSLPRLQKDVPLDWNRIATGN